VKSVTGSGKWPIATGSFPVWSRNGRELFWEVPQPNPDLMVATVRRAIRSLPRNLGCGRANSASGDRLASSIFPTVSAVESFRFFAGLSGEETAASRWRRRPKICGISSRELVVRQPARCGFVRVLPECPAGLESALLRSAKDCAIDSRSVTVQNAATTRLMRVE
jgi:hypothetical protein